MSSQLFSPISLRDLTLENRVTVSPMCQYASENGNAADWHMMHLGGFAVSGPGLVITEATGISPEGRISPNCLGLYSDDNARTLKRVVDFCHAESRAKMGIQLAHAGRKGSTAPPWAGAKPLAPGDGAWQTLGPSAIPYGDFPAPASMDAAAIGKVKDDFVAATRRADQIGFDLVELHYGHGYLMHSFLSPLSNAREDEYGGGRDGRMKLALEVFEACREVWPAHKPMGVRFSAQDWMEGGWNEDDSVALAQALHGRECDYVTTSSGGISPDQTKGTGAPEQVDIAARVRREVGIKTIGLGSITKPDQAEAIIAEGKADLVALAKGMLMNPRWTWHAAVKLGAEFTPPPRYFASKAVIPMVAGS